jgi:hypothetical protein
VHINITSTNVMAGWCVDRGQRLPRAPTTPHGCPALVGCPYTGGPIGLATELRNREKVLGTTIDSRRDLRIRYTEPASPPPAGVTNRDQYRDL